MIATLRLRINELQKFSCIGIFILFVRVIGSSRQKIPL